MSYPLIRLHKIQGAPTGPFWGVGSQGGHRDTATSSVAHGRGSIHRTGASRLRQSSYICPVTGHASPSAATRNVDVVGKRQLREPDGRANAGGHPCRVFDASTTSASRSGTSTR